MHIDDEITLNEEEVMDFNSTQNKFFMVHQGSFMVHQGYKQKFYFKDRFKYIFIQKKRKKKGRYLFVNNKKKIYLLVTIISNDDIAIVISY